MIISIFKQFFLLGCFSFGGPAAHIGYFHQKFVQQLKWLSQEEYGQIVALSQFLPGPGSSQVGFALGYHKAGLKGAIAAFIGFTFPSMLLMIIIAYVSNVFVNDSYFYGIVHGLKLLAVVVVADAVFTMFNSFCKDIITRSIAVFSAFMLLIVSGIFSQMIVLVMAAIIGLRYLSSTALKTTSVAKLSLTPLIIFAGLFLILPYLVNDSPLWQLTADFYQAGSLVFGGGHVVLPLLQELLTEQLSTDTFLTGYSAAQAVPGPMFTLATFLGFQLTPNAPILGAVVATLAVFLPGFLLMLAFLKHWQGLASMPKFAGAVQGINAAVVGLLASALYQPVFSSTVFDSIDMAVVLIGFYLLKVVKVPIVLLVGSFAFAGILLTYF